MYYEINVSRNGKHYFATAERSLITNTTAQKVFKDFQTRFPTSEGFSVTVYKYETVGHLVDFTKGE